MEPIKVEGLAQFRRDLKKLDADLPKALRVALNEVADIIVADARPDVPRRSGRAASTVRAKSTGTKMRVAGGGRKAPQYPWLDFGGKVGAQRQIKRPYKKGGRFIYPSFHRTRDSGKLQKQLSKSLVKTADSAGIHVT